MDIKEMRRRIDAIDERLQALLNDRARVAQVIGKAKAQAGASDGYKPGREAEVLHRIIARNEGPLEDEQVARIFREAMSACLRLESPLQVAYLGPAGTYTEAALYRFFGHGVTPVPVASVDPIFREVESGNAHYGVVPIENSLEGAVSHTLDRFAQTDLRICGEVTMPIHHHLLVRPGDAVEDIGTVHAHPQSFGQCREWLEEHLPDVPRHDARSNAEAAKLVAEQGGAAIASKVAAELYGLDIAASRIEDDPRNTTRFLVVGDQDTEPSGADKTTVMLAARDRPGALLDLLRPFSELEVNMTRIESRPSRRQPWDYHFFVDLEGHQQEERVVRLLGRLRDEAAYCKVLGSYPRAVV